MYYATYRAKNSININGMDKITVSLKRALRAKNWKFNMLYNSLGKDGTCDMTSTSLHQTSSTSHFTLPHTRLLHIQNRQNEVERFVSKWNNAGPTASVIFDEDMGIPMPDTYSFCVHASGGAPEKVRTLKHGLNISNSFVGTHLRYGK